eukprot:4208589-Pyramimonas_sp.AAC.1
MYCASAGVSDRFGVSQATPDRSPTLCCQSALRYGIAATSRVLCGSRRNSTDCIQSATPFPLELGTESGENGAKSHILQW